MTFSSDFEGPAKPSYLCVALASDGDWTLVAIDFGDGVGNIPQSYNLNFTERGMLPATLLSQMEITEVRLSHSGGDVDVTTQNPSIIQRVKDFQTLHRGSPDNTINNDWTGTNAARITTNAICTTTLLNSLDANIAHVCGNAQSFNWMPQSSIQRTLWSAGEITDNEYLALWVKTDTKEVVYKLDGEIYVNQIDPSDTKTFEKLNELGATVCNICTECTPTVSGGGSSITYTADNDLVMTGANMQTGAPLVKDTTTTGAFYRHWANNTNTNPTASGIGFLYRHKQSLIAGDWQAGMVIGSRNLISGYRHDRVNGNDNIVAGDSNDHTGTYGATFGVNNTVKGSNMIVSGTTNNVSGGSHAVFGSTHSVTGGTASIYAGFDTESNMSYSAVFGYQTGFGGGNTGSYSTVSGYRTRHISGIANGLFGYRNTVASSYNLIGGADVTVSGSSNLVGGGNQSVSRDYNLVGGSNHTVTGDRNMVAGYLHTVGTGFANVVGGYRNTVTANRSTAFGDSNTVAGTMNHVLGYLCEVANAYNFLTGYDHDVSGNYGAAIGRNNTIGGGNYNAAFGYSHDIYGGTSNMAYGYNCGVSGGSYNAVFGRNVNITGGNDNKAIGRNTVISTGSDNLALGNSITSNNGNSVVVGGAGQKLGFFNGVPVAKQSLSNTATPGQIVAALKAYGLFT